jgi:hypothetical protein
MRKNMLRRFHFHQFNSHRGRRRELAVHTTHVLPDRVTNRLMLVSGVRSGRNDKREIAAGNRLI